MNEAEDPAEPARAAAEPDPDDDLDFDEGPKLHTALPPRLESWRRRSAAGAILTGIGLGLKAALTPEREEPSIVMQASGEPPTDLSVEAELGGIIPADNVVRIRPWLLGQPVADTDADADAERHQATTPAGSAGSAGSGDVPGGPAAGDDAP